jgi:hypothetical protein
VHAEFLDHVGIGAVVAGLHDPDRVAALHHEVILRRRDEVPLARRRHLGAGAEPRGLRRAQAEPVVPDARANAPRAPPPVPEVHDHDVVGGAGQDPNGHARRAAVIADRDHGLIGISDPEHGDTQALRRVRADVGHAVPGDLRQRLRHLLQPGVVGVATVQDRRIRPEDDLQARACGRWCGRGTGGRGRGHGRRRRPASQE